MCTCISRVPGGKQTSLLQVVSKILLKTDVIFTLHCFEELLFNDFNRVGKPQLKICTAALLYCNLEKGSKHIDYQSWVHERNQMGR